MEDGEFLLLVSYCIHYLKLSSVITHLYSTTQPHKHPANGYQVIKAIKQPDASSHQIIIYTKATKSCKNLKKESSTVPMQRRISWLSGTTVEDIY